MRKNGSFRKCSIKGSLGNPKWLFNGSSMERLFLKVYSESTYSRSSWLVPPPPQVWACCLISPCSPDLLQIVWVVQCGTDLYQNSLQTRSLKANLKDPNTPTNWETDQHCQQVQGHSSIVNFPLLFGFLDCCKILSHYLDPSYPVCLSEIHPQLQLSQTSPSELLLLK